MLGSVVHSPPVATIKINHLVSLFFLSKRVKNKGNEEGNFLTSFAYPYITQNIPSQALFITPPLSRDISVNSHLYK